MNAAQIKFLVLLACVLALWRVFEIPGVSTAFWALITVGAIPGSNTILGSDMVLRILCILFAVCFFLIFRKEFFASLPRHKHKQAVAANPPDVSSIEVPAAAARFNPYEQTVIILKKQKDRPILTPVRPTFVLLGYIAIDLVRIVTALESYAEWFMRAMAALIRTTSLWLWRYLKSFGRAAYRVTYITIRAVGRVIALAWRASEPYIRAFDSWLEAQLRANQRTAGVLRISSEVGRATMDAYRKAQDTTRKLIVDK